MTTPLPFTHTNESVVVIHQGRPHTVHRGTVQFHMLRTAILNEDWTTVVTCLSPSGSLQTYLGDRYSVEDRAVLLDGKPVPDGLAHRMWAMADAGEDPAPLFRFYERLAKNPSWNSVQQLYNFLRHAGIPLEPDGTFLAYKAVKADYTDVYTGKIDNTPGMIHQMDRNLVSDDPRTPCHFGFHVGALEYARTFHHGGQLLICRVDPEHVVCVPEDYSHQKMRVCAYEVVGHYAGIPLSDTVHHEVVVEDKDGDWDDDEDEDEDLLEAADEAEDLSDGEELDHIERVGRQLDEAFEELESTPKAKAKAKAKPKAKKLTRAAAFNRMQAKGLMEESLSDLRLYAVHTLKIIGAGSLPGGKSALVSKILKFRRRK